MSNRIFHKPFTLARERSKDLLRKALLTILIDQDMTWEDFDKCFEKFCRKQKITRSLQLGCLSYIVRDLLHDRIEDDMSWIEFCRFLDFFQLMPQSHSLVILDPRIMQTTDRVSFGRF